MLSDLLSKARSENYRKENALRIWDLLLPISQRTPPQGVANRRRAVGCRNLLTQSRELFFAALFYMRKFSSIGGILNKTSPAGQQSVIWLSEDQNLEVWRTELIYWGGLTIKAVIIGKLSWSYFMIQNIGGKCAQNFIIVQLEESLTNQLFKWVSDGL